MLRVDVVTGRVDTLTFGPGWAFNEPIHVPSKTPGHDGWLVLTVDHEIDETRQRELERGSPEVAVLAPRDAESRSTP